MSTFTSAERLAEEELLAKAAYDRHVKPNLKPEDDGKFVAVAYISGDYEIDADDFSALERLSERRPGEHVWLMRAGDVAAHRYRSPRRLMPTIR